MEPEYLRIARVMLGVESLDPNLSIILNKVNTYIHNVNLGELRSRQSIAIIVMMWELGWLGKAKK